MSSEYIVVPLLLFLLNVGLGQDEFVEFQTRPQIKFNPNQELRLAPSQYVEIAGKEYFLSEYVSLSWFESQTACEAINMTLANIQTQEENQALRDFFAASTDLDLWRWIDGYRGQQTTEWYWNSTGEPFTFTDWGPDQPDNPVDYSEDCTNFAGFFGWDDDHCFQWLLSYMCEAI